MKGEHFITRCNACGRFLRRTRWMRVGSYYYNQGYRPLCYGCSDDE